MSAHGIFDDLSSPSHRACRCCTLKAPEIVKLAFSSELPVAQDLLILEHWTYRMIASRPDATNEYNYYMGNIGNAQKHQGQTSAETPVS